MTRRSHTQRYATFTKVYFPAKPWILHLAIDRLEEMYIDEGKTIAEIAKYIGRDQDTVIDALLLVGLEIGEYIRSDLMHSSQAA